MHSSSETQVLIRLPLCVVTDGDFFILGPLLSDLGKALLAGGERLDEVLSPRCGGCARDDRQQFAVPLLPLGQLHPQRPV